ncbi:unnamed protein product [Prorocentrum cordatum]|uniref:Uncharacterized protein n=1 Tax=Prorocentrum cordatum TaxID=2364126 RepID=A0ABN9PU57_9DINO|nr:unnamed protein product [Polarella glacialis]
MSRWSAPSLSIAATWSTIQFPSGGHFGHPCEKQLAQFKMHVESIGNVSMWTLCLILQGKQSAKLPDECDQARPNMIHRMWVDYLAQRAFVRQWSNVRQQRITSLEATCKGLADMKLWVANKGAAICTHHTDAVRVARASWMGGCQAKAQKTAGCLGTDIGGWIMVWTQRLPPPCLFLVLHRPRRPRGHLEMKRGRVGLTLIAQQV